MKNELVSIDNVITSHPENGTKNYNQDNTSIIGDNTIYLNDSSVAKTDEILQHMRFHKYQDGVCTMVHKDGSLSASNDGGNSWRNDILKDSVKIVDIIRTGKTSYIGIPIRDKSKLVYITKSLCEFTLRGTIPVRLTPEDDIVYKPSSIDGDNVILGLYTIGEIRGGSFIFQPVVSLSMASDTVSDIPYGLSGDDKRGTYVAHITASGEYHVNHRIINSEGTVISTSKLTSDIPTTIPQFVAGETVVRIMDFRVNYYVDSDGLEVLSFICIIRSGEYTLMTIDGVLHRSHTGEESGGDRAFICIDQVDQSVLFIFNDIIEDRRYPVVQRIHADGQSDDLVQLGNVPGLEYDYNDASINAILSNGQKVRHVVQTDNTMIVTLDSMVVEVSCDLNSSNIIFGKGINKGKLTSGSPKSIRICGKLVSVTHGNGDLTCSISPLDSWNTIDIPDGVVTYPDNGGGGTGGGVIVPGDTVVKTVIPIPSGNAIRSILKYKFGSGGFNKIVQIVPIGGDGNFIMSFNDSSINLIIGNVIRKSEIYVPPSWGSGYHVVTIGDVLYLFYNRKYSDKGLHCKRYNINKSRGTLSEVKGDGYHGIDLKELPGDASSGIVRNGQLDNVVVVNGEIYVSFINNKHAVKYNSDITSWSYYFDTSVNYIDTDLADFTADQKLVIELLYYTETSFDFSKGTMTTRIPSVLVPPVVGPSDGITVPYSGENMIAVYMDDTVKVYDSVLDDGNYIIDYIIDYKGDIISISGNRVVNITSGRILKNFKRKTPTHIAEYEGLLFYIIKAAVGFELHSDGGIIDTFNDHDCLHFKNVNGTLVITTGTMDVILFNVNDGVRIVRYNIPVTSVAFNGHMYLIGSIEGLYGSRGLDGRSMKLIPYNIYVSDIVYDGVRELTYIAHNDGLSIIDNDISIIENKTIRSKGNPYGGRNRAISGDVFTSVTGDRTVTKFDTKTKLTRVITIPDEFMGSFDSTNAIVDFIVFDSDIVKVLFRSLINDDYIYLQFDGYNWSKTNIHDSISTNVISTSGISMCYNAGKYYLLSANDNKLGVSTDGVSFTTTFDAVNGFNSISYVDGHIVLTSEYKFRVSKSDDFRSSAMVTIPRGVMDDDVLDRIDSIMYPSIGIINDTRSDNMKDNPSNSEIIVISNAFVFCMVELDSQHIRYTTQGQGWTRDYKFNPVGIFSTPTGNIIATKTGGNGTNVSNIGYLNCNASYNQDILIDAHDIKINPYSSVTGQYEWVDRIGDDIFIMGDQFITRVPICDLVSPDTGDGSKFSVKFKSGKGLSILSYDKITSVNPIYMDSKSIGGSLNSNFKYDNRLDNHIKATIVGLQETGFMRDFDSDIIFNTTKVILENNLVIEDLYTDRNRIDKGVAASNLEIVDRDDMRDISKFIADTDEELMSGACTVIINL